MKTSLKSFVEVAGVVDPGSVLIAAFQASDSVVEAEVADAVVVVVVVAATVVDATKGGAAVVASLAATASNVLGNPIFSSPMEPISLLISKLVAMEKLVMAE